MPFARGYTLLLFLFSFLIRAQDCQTEFAASATVLSKNKIKKVRVFNVDTISGNKKLIRQLFVTGDGKIHTVHIYDAEPDTFYYRKRCGCEKDSSRCVTVTHSIGNKGSVTLLDSTQTFFNGEKQLTRRIDELRYPEHSRTIFHFNPNDIQSFTSETYKFSDGDTLSFESKFEGYNISKRTFREKKNGKWHEHVWYAEYLNGKLIEYRETYNGKLISSLSPGEEDPRQPTADPEKIPEVVSAAEFTDTIRNSRKSPLKRFRIKKLSPAKSTATFIQISHFTDADKKQLSFSQYYYSNGLPVLVYQPGNAHVEVYEYE